MPRPLSDQQLFQSGRSQRIANIQLAEADVTQVIFKSNVANEPLLAPPLNVFNERPGARYGRVASGPEGDSPLSRPLR